MVYGPLSPSRHQLLLRYLTFVLQPTGGYFSLETRTHSTRESSHDHALRSVDASASWMWMMSSVLGDWSAHANRTDDTRPNHPRLRVAPAQVHTTLLLRTRGRPEQPGWTCCRAVQSRACRAVWKERLCTLGPTSSGADFLRSVGGGVRQHCVRCARSGHTTSQGGQKLRQQALHGLWTLSTCSVPLQC